MKHLTKLTGLVLAIGLTACSNDMPGPDPNGNGGSTGDFYATLTLQLPTGTRSGTVTPDPSDPNDPAQSNSGYEVGKDYENNVDEVFVVLAMRTVGTDGKVSYEYLASGTSQSILDQTKTDFPTYVVQFNTQELKDKLPEAGTIETAVFAYCNPSTNFSTTFDKAAFIDQIGEISDGDAKEIANKETPSFMMTNALEHTVALPTYTVLATTNYDSTHPFNLGTVRVERIACRFDFKETKIGTNAPNVYPITEQVSDELIANITLDGLSLFNEAKQFYFLPRMSADGTMTDAKICGVETPLNYVVSPNFAAKTLFAKNGEYSEISNKYFYNLNTLPSEYVFTPFSDLKEDDNHDSDRNPTWPNGQITDPEGYHIWRYATENTIPQADAQKYGITTGVVFRGEITASSAEGVTAANFAADIATGEPVYAFRQNINNMHAPVSIMLGSAKRVYDYSKTHNTSMIRDQFLKAFAAGYFTVKVNGTALAVTATADEIFNTPEGAEVVVTGAANNTDFAADFNFGFVVYTSTPDANGANHYYCYYYYYNRHNDNGDNSAMGIMEFATVRNNIYKLKVDNVLKFGVPGDTPPPPPHDDEDPDIYFKVSVQVLDWVVRINNIIF